MPQVTIRKFSYCHTGHAPIYHAGQQCPACRQRAAAETIAQEYLKVVAICGRLLDKVRNKAKHN